MSTTMKWMFVGDLQIPYQDNRAVALTLKVMKAWKPDAVDFVGDIDDQLEYSTFSDGTTDEFFNQLKKQEDPDPLPFIKKNADGARVFYADARKVAKNADMHSSLGNHDIRIRKYINRKAPEFYDQMTPEFLWGLDNQGITWRWYHEKPLKRFANIHVHHGSTTTTTGLAVRQDIDNYNISLVRGHDHRGGVVYKTYPLSDNQLVGMCCGHLCDPNQYGLLYADNPSWELGFGIGHVEGDNAHLQFIRITPDYKCVVDGRVFEG